MRLSDGQRAPVLGVNLGKLGFLAEVDGPTCPARSRPSTTTSSPRTPAAVDAVLGGRRSTAFNDVAVVRVPGAGTAVVAVRVGGQPFVSYAADASSVATPTGSTGYKLLCRWPITSPAVEALR